MAAEIMAYPFHIEPRGVTIGVTVGLTSALILIWLFSLLASFPFFELLGLCVLPLLLAAHASGTMALKVQEFRHFQFYKGGFEVDWAVEQIERYFQSYGIDYNVTLKRSAAYWIQMEDEVVIVVSRYLLWSRTLLKFRRGKFADDEISAILEMVCRLPGMFRRSGPLSGQIETQASGSGSSR